MIKPRDKYPPAGRGASATGARAGRGSEACLLLMPSAHHLGWARLKKASFASLPVRLPANPLG